MKCVLIPAIEKCNIFRGGTLFIKCVCLLLLAWLPVAAFSQQLPFKHLTVEQGLSQNTVLAICQDSLGYMWFGTQNGLNRFNGYELETFESSEKDTLSLSNSFINTLCPGPDYTMWVGTRDGVCLWDQHTGRFERMHRYFANDTLHGHYDFWDIITDSEGAVWAMGEARGFHIFKKEKGQREFRKVLTLHEAANNTMLELYGQLLEDRDGNIWIGTSKCGLWVYLKKDRRFTRITFPGQADYSITGLARDNSNTLWIGTVKNGLFQTTSPGQAIVSIPGLNDPAIRSLYVDRQNRLWVGTDRGGLNLYVPQQQKFLFFDHDINNSNTLLHNSMWSIYEDRQNILWAGTYAGGVNYHDPNTGTFELFRAGSDAKDNLSNNTITGFAEDENGNVWVATDRGGLNYFDRKTRGFRHYRHIPGNAHSLSSDVIQHIRETSRHQLWIATWLGGLNYLDKRTGNFYTYVPEKNNDHSISSSTVNYVFEDSKKNLWLGTSVGLNFVNEKYTAKGNPARLRVNRFIHNDATPASLTNNSVKVIFEDREENIWAGTQEGLNLFDPATQSFYNNRNNPRNKKLFTRDYILCMTETPQGDFLLGTNDNGLLYYYRKTDSLVVYNKQHGLTSNTVFGILKDTHNTYWLSTNNGLVRFDDTQKTFTVYNQHDGLQSNEFKHNAYARLASGEMLFGGINGFNIFHPDSVRKIPMHIPVVISGFRISNEEITPGTGSPLQQDITLTKAIDLLHNQSFISFEFTALNFSLPLKNQYAYRLSGLDDAWHYVGAQRSANYSYLPPGHYVFQVMTANTDGRWTIPVSLEVVIHPAWWNTIWFRTLIVLLLAGAVMAVFKTRTRQLTLRRKMLEETVKERTLELEQKNKLLSERQEEIMQQKEELKTQRDNVEQQYRTIQTLSEIGQQITSSIKKEELIFQLRSIIYRLMDVSMFSIGHLDENGEAIEFSTLRENHDIIEESKVFLHEERFSVLCMERRDIIRIDDMDTEYESYFPQITERYQDSFKSAIYLPLFSMEGTITGMLIVKSFRKNAYSDVHLSTLKNLAAYIGIAYDNAHVYKEIEAQSALLARQSQKLEELDKLKTRFFINISHEFRTPLTLIVSPLEKMIAQHSVDNWPRMQRQLEVMNRNARQLLGLINELLEVRNIESSGTRKLMAAEQDLVGFTESVMQRFEDLSAQYNIRLNLHADQRQVLLWFDRDMMEKVLTNLFANAFKYTPSGGRIETSILMNPVKKSVTLLLSDSGSGIPASELPYVFDRFYQGASPINAIQGSSGIGLSFVKDLIEFQGGHISVTSHPEEGTSFAIQLPLGNEHLQQRIVDALHDEHDSSERDMFPFESMVPEIAVPERNETAAPLLLIVEDNPDVRELLKIELATDYPILEAADGKAGADLALLHVPDLVISDVMMPVMDGIQLCDILKADERTSHIPVILLTAKTGEESQIKGFETGADDYVSKPFNINILRARVQNLIASRKKLHAIFSSKEKMEVREVIENIHDRNFVEKIDTAIMLQLKNPELNHEVLARDIGMSKTQLYRKLQAITGKTVHEYIRNHRLRYGHTLLQSRPEMLVSEIAYEVGFKDPAYFSKSFHTFFNLWPKDVRTEKTNI